MRQNAALCGYDLKHTFKHTRVHQNVGMGIHANEELGDPLKHFRGAKGQMAVTVHGVLLAGNRQGHLARVDRIFWYESDLR